MVFFRMGFLLAQVYERMCRNPADQEPDYVLSNVVERWRDVPPKQLDRVRMGGDTFLGLLLAKVLGLKVLSFFLIV